uniref:Gag-Pro-Pol polyprotein n=1 Tax=Suricata suricatta TaxID=37032 RepID=A0A673UKJ6_SURSU
MGNKEKKFFTEVLLHLLNQRRIKVTHDEITRFLHFVQEQCPWFPEEGTVDLQTWNKVGEQLRLYGPENVPVDVFSLWNWIRDALDPDPRGGKLSSNNLATGTTPPLPRGQNPTPLAMAVQDNEDSECHDSDGNETDLADEEAQCEAKKEEKGLPLDSSKPIRSKLKKSDMDRQALKPQQEAGVTPTAPYVRQCRDPPCPEKLLRTASLSNLAQAKRQAMLEGDFDFPLCFPVTFGPMNETDGAAGDPNWIPGSYKVLKELKAACAQYGPNAPYTITLVDSLTNHCMTPYDWFQVAKSCLPPGDYVRWRAEYEDRARDHLRRNRIKMREAGVSGDMIMGHSGWEAASDQVRIPLEGLKAVGTIATEAWKALPSGFSSATSLTEVRQGAEEKYEDFVARLVSTAERLTTNKDISEMIVKQLAFENANSVCKALLRPIKQTGQLNDFIRQCADVGPAFVRGVAIAAALQGKTYAQYVQTYGNKPKGKDPACFRCGQIGHFKSNCPRVNKRSGPIHRPIEGGPGAPCPRCQKGFHWARDCKSRYHKDGTFDSQSGKLPEGACSSAPDNNRSGIAQPILRNVFDLLHATPGRAGLDLCSTSSAILTPDSMPVALPTGVTGPLPEGVVGIILGRSSTSLKGIQVIPGVIDSDYTGEIKIMVSPPNQTVQIMKGQRIAQLLLLPYLTNNNLQTQEPRQDKGFGPTDLAFWEREITDKRPLKTIKVNGKEIKGLLDTGADVSCISGKDWPSSWPTHSTVTSLVGTGSAPSVAKSSQILPWTSDDSSGTFTPYVIPSIPCTLWGRDVLSQMGLLLLSPDEIVTGQMLNMHFNPDKRLGKTQQGIKDPIMPTVRSGRQGLGFQDKDPQFVEGAMVQVAADPIRWKHQDPVWVEQWPLTAEKLEAATVLVSEQLQLGHIEPSLSPWNTPIFVMKKKSGKWRLLQDLRAINVTMETMGALQPGLPSPVAIPKGDNIIVINLQDCFFSIPLHPDDCKHFAFSLPSPNLKRPFQRFQWKVLPQGMKNSPTLCQKYVARALSGIRHKYPEVYLIHYMDDILLAHQDKAHLHDVLDELIETLSAQGLKVAPEKTQMDPPYSYLGRIIENQTVTLQPLQLKTEHLCTLKDFQKLLGDINWIRPFLKLSTRDLIPLFEILHGDSHPNSKRELTPLALESLSKVNEALQGAVLTRINYSKPWSLIILPTEHSPTACLWQEGILEWLCLSATPKKVLADYPSLIAQIIMNGRERSRELFAQEPAEIVLPCSKFQIEELMQGITGFQVAMAGYTGSLGFNTPQDPILQFGNLTSFIFPTKTKTKPVEDALLAFTAGSSNGMASIIIYKNSSEPKIISFQTRETSAQRAQLVALIRLFQETPERFNLFSGSKYVVGLFPAIETATVPVYKTGISGLLLKLQVKVQQRQEPFYIGHIRAHSRLPGPLSEGNALADFHTKVACLTMDPVREAQEGHNIHHEGSRASDHSRTGSTKS